MSCDDNPLYLDFWPVVSKIWFERFNIKPVLIYISTNWSYKNKLKEASIIYINPISTLPIYIQSLWARYYYTSIFPNDVCIISDIDMIPISHDYFINQLEPLSENSYIHLYPNSGRKILPSCYHIAKGKVFKEYLNLPMSFNRSISNLMYFTHDNYKKQDSWWYSDEIYATHCLSNKNIIKLPRTEMKRLDRLDWKFDENDIKNNKFIDAHCIRPYVKYKEYIDKLVNLLI